MTTRQYLNALDQLGLTTASQATAKALGCTVRQCQRLSGGAQVSRPIELLLKMYLKHGLENSDE